MSLYNKELADGFAKVADIKAPALGGKKPQSTDAWSSVSEIPGLSDMWNSMETGPADASANRLESALDMMNKMNPGLKDRIGRDYDKAEWERGAPSDLFADEY
jgi:hypothetical protein